MIDRRIFLAAALAAAIAQTGSQPMPAPLSMFELRQYTLYGGRRDELIGLFEREFVAPQDAVGAQVLGTFTDLDDPDRFVWLRGFTDMAARFEALTAFYGGPVWQAHRSAANATMVDSGNVLLLRPGRGAWPAAQPSGTAGLVRIAIHYLGGVDPAAFLAYFEQAMTPAVAAAGGSVETILLTSPERNSFTRLPVREGEPALIWLTRFESRTREEGFARRLSQRSGWRDAAPEAVLPALMRKPEILRLAPTRGSRLR